MVITSNNKIIEMTDVGTCFGTQWIHKHLNFTVQRGSIVAIVGGSGSGKTTVLRAILMLLKPKEGSISVLGTNVVNCTEEEATRLRRRWGVLFQRNALFSSLSVLENVMFPLKQFTSLEPKDCEEIARIKIALVGLPNSSATKYPAELSGGMQKRAAAARAIAMDPELLILDEPTSGLDPISAAQFDQLILQLREMLGLTAVMVSHDLNTLWRVPDEVAFLGEGKVLAQENMEQLVKNPHPLIQHYFEFEQRKA